jgi:hypothetical protein
VRVVVMMVAHFDGDARYLDLDVGEAGVIWIIMNADEVLGT